MIPVIPTYITLIVVVTNAAIVFAVWRLLSRGAQRAGFSATEVGEVRIVAGLFFGLWYGAVLLFAPTLASLSGHDPYYITPIIPLFALSGPILAILAYRTSSMFRQVVDAVSLPEAIGTQVYRVIGFNFILLLGLGQLPAHFALPAGWGDVAIGLTAPLVGLLLARGIRWPAIAWSVVGLLDLAVAVGMGTGVAAPLLLPGVSYRLPAAAVMGAFPMILVPTFAVPVSVLLHLIALRGILRAPDRAPVEAFAR